MSLRWLYWSYIALLHAGLGWLLFRALPDKGPGILLGEGLLLLSGYAAFRLYRAFVRPLAFLRSGAEALKDKDFGLRLLPTGGREMDELIDVYNGMLAQLREERAEVQAQHYFLEKLIQASPAGILLLDYDGRIAEANPRARQLLPLGEAYRGKSLEALPAPIFRHIARLPEGRSELLALNGVERLRCEVSSFVHRGFPRRFVLLQELSRDILQAEKRAYGKVIRMMAHEVNNSLGAVNSILQSAEAAMQEGDAELAEALGVALQRNERLRQFMQNFAEVLRLPAPQVRPADLGDLVERALALMRPQAEALGIALRREGHAGPFPLPMDARHIEQALINILKNALEAIGERAGGSVRVILEAAPPRLRIADNGAGIAPEHAGKLFTPFFSSKPEGQGIGLTLVREIFLQHGWPFSLYTAADGWTYFDVALQQPPVRPGT